MRSNIFCELRYGWGESVMTWSDDVCDDVIYILLPSSHLSVLSLIRGVESWAAKHDKQYHSEQRSTDKIQNSGLISSSIYLVIQSLKKHSRLVSSLSGLFSQYQVEVDRNHEHEKNLLLTSLMSLLGFFPSKLMIILYIVIDIHFKYHIELNSIYFEP